MGNMGDRSFFTNKTNKNIKLKLRPSGASLKIRSNSNSKKKTLCENNKFFRQKTLGCINSHKNKYFNYILKNRFGELNNNNNCNINNNDSDGTKMTNNKKQIKNLKSFYSSDSSECAIETKKGKKLLQKFFSSFFN